VILARYISVTLFKAIALVLIFIFGLHMVMWFIGEMGDLGTGDYHFKEALLFVLLQAPYQLCELFPFASLIGGLVGLGILATNHELVVMRCSGLSTVRILLLSMSVALVQEFIAPSAVNFAENQKAMHLSGGQAIRTSGGIWIKQGQNYFHIEGIESENKLHGVIRYEFDEAMKLTKASYAETATIHSGYWSLEHLKETVFEANSVRSHALPSAQWQLNIPPSVLELAYVYPEELTIRQLQTHMAEQDDNQSGMYALLYWQRLVKPLNTLVMLLLAVPIIFGPLRRTSIGLRLLSGTTIGFIFYVVTKVMGAASVVYQFSPLWSVLCPPLLLLLLGIYFLKRYA